MHIQLHEWIVIAIKIVEMRVIAKNEVMNPFGGRRGSLKKTISGHKNLQVAK